MQLTVVSQSGADGPWDVAVDGSEVTFNGTNVVLIQLKAPYFLRAHQDSEVYTISAPQGAFVDYAEIPNAFAGGDLLSITVASRALSGRIMPELVSAGTRDSFKIQFDVAMPLAPADEIIVRFPTALADGSPFPEGSGTVELPDQLAASFVPTAPFTAGVLYADKESNAVVITDLGGFGTRSRRLDDDDDGDGSAAYHTIEFEIAGIQMPVLYGTLAPYLVLLRFASGDADASLLVPGPTLENLEVPVFAFSSAGADGYATTVDETDGRTTQEAPFSPVNVLAVHAVDADQIPGANVTYAMDADPNADADAKNCSG